MLTEQSQDFCSILFLIILNGEMRERERERESESALKMEAVGQHT
jgi:hypothetical protein